MSLTIGVMTWKGFIKFVSIETKNEMEVSEPYVEGTGLTVSSNW
jgi:hypothetical protein